MQPQTETAAKELAAIIPEYYVAPGTKIQGTIIFPGVPTEWPAGLLDAPSGHQDVEYYGGFVLAESIAFKVMQDRMVAAWNAAKGVPADQLRPELMMHLLARIGDLEAALRLVRDCYTKGLGHHYRVIVLDTVDQALEMP